MAEPVLLYCGGGGVLTLNTGGQVSGGLLATLRQRARDQGFNPDTECTFSMEGGGGFSCGRSTSSSSSSSSSSDDAVIGGAVAAVVVVVGGLVWYYWPRSKGKGKGKTKPVSFTVKELDGSAYMPGRSWFGIEQQVSEAVNLSAGGFWLRDPSAKTPLPSGDNMGAEFSMAYGLSSLGSVGLSVVVYHRDRRFADLSAGSREKGWDSRIGLRWSKKLW